MKSDWPEFGEELGRKSLEHVRRYLKKWELGKISTGKVIIVMDTILETSQGLMNEETWDTLNEIYEELKATYRKEIILKRNSA
jgi:hypothetical protein